MSAIQQAMMMTGSGLPPGSDPAGFANVLLLIGFEGADASTATTDESSFARTLTVAGNAQIDTAQFKFGASSGLFDGSTDAWTAADSADWNIGAGDLTIEMWFRPAAIGSRQFLCGQTASGAASVRNLVEITAAGKLRYLSNGSANADIVGTTTLVAGTWYHLAFTKESTTYRIFVDGNLEASTTATITFSDSSNPFGVGRCGAHATATANGHIDEFRYTGNVARYTASFTPPAAAFPRF